MRNCELVGFADIKEINGCAHFRVNCRIAEIHYSRGNKGVAEGVPKDKPFHPR